MKTQKQLEEISDILNSVKKEPMRLSENQVHVLRLIAVDEDPYKGTIFDRNAFIGRSNTLWSLRRHGLIELTKRGLHTKWVLTAKGKGEIMGLMNKLMEMPCRCSCGCSKMTSAQVCARCWMDAHMELRPDGTLNGLRSLREDMDERRCDDNTPRRSRRARQTTT